MSYLRQFQYSSYLDYVGTKREEGAILNPKEFPNYFEKSHEFKDFVRDWLDFKKERDGQS